MQFASAFLKFGYVVPDFTKNLEGDLCQSENSAYSAKDLCHVDAGRPLDENQRYRVKHAFIDVCTAQLLEHMTPRRSLKSEENGRSVPIVIPDPGLQDAFTAFDSKSAMMLAVGRFELKCGVCILRFPWANLQSELSATTNLK